MNIDTLFTRELLKLRHVEVREQFPEIKNIVQCASVTMPLKGMFFVQITAPGRPMFNYDCRAYNATEARYKAWGAWLQTYGKKEDAA